MTESRWWRRPGVVVGLLVLGAMVVVAVVGPRFLPDAAAQPDVLGGANLPPGAGHPLGTDQLSRDVLSRLVMGARISLAVAVLSVALAVSLGTLVGLLSGFLGGRVDMVLMRLVDGALAIPRLFLLLLLLAAWQQVPLWALVVVIGATGWLGTSRLVRAEVRRIATEPFIDAATALGASRTRILLRHVLPNALGPVIVAATLGIGNVILIEAGLSFLGLGVQPPTPSWGGMIFDARETMITAPWTMLAPGLAIVATVLAANLVGESLRRGLDLGPR